MQFTVNRVEFLAAMQLASGVVPTKTTKDILRSVKVVVGAESLSLMATDGEIGLVSTVSCISSESGECLLPMDKTVQILSVSREESMDFNVDGVSVVISSALSEFGLSTADVKDYPPLPTSGDGDVTCAMNGPDLVRILNRTSFACDDTSKNYSLGGVRIEVGENGIVGVATDTKRMPIDVAPCRGSKIGSCVIPLKAVKIILKLAAEGEVDLSIGASSVTVKSGSAVMSSQLVSGRFPEWKRVVPKCDRSIDFVASPLLDAVRRSMIIVSEESRGVLFEFSKGRLRLSSTVADLGKSRNDVPIGYDGDTVTINLDPQYVADMLRHLDSSSQVSFGFVDEDSAILMSSGEYRCVIMPLVKT